MPYRSVRSTTKKGPGVSLRKHLAVAPAAEDRVSEPVLQSADDAPPPIARQAQNDEQVAPKKGCQDRLELAGMSPAFQEAATDADDVLAIDDRQSRRCLAPWPAKKRLPEATIGTLPARRVTRPR